MMNSRFLIPTIVAASVATTIPVFAADVTWKGGSSGTWDYTTECWEDPETGEELAFSAGDNATISSTSCTITLNQDITVGTFSSTKSVTLTGSGTLLVSDMSKFQQILTLESGITLKFAEGVNADFYGLTTRIVVNSGATLDVNGNSETAFNLLTLAGGTLTSSLSVNGDSSRTVKQLSRISLDKDSTVYAGSGVTFGMLGKDYEETSINLGYTYTLTKSGEGTFFLVNTALYRTTAKGDDFAGMFTAAEGTLEFDGADASRALITVESGATLAISKVDNYGDSTIAMLRSSGTVNIASDASLTLTGSSRIVDNYVTFSGNSTISGELVISGSLAVTGGAVADLTGVTASQVGGSGALSVSGEGSTVKISSYAWGSSSNFGSNMYNGLLQISDGGTLEITEAQASGGAGDRGFAVTSGTGTYRYSGEGTSYISQPSDSRNIHLADGATLVFDVANADATLDVSMKIANGMSASSDVSGSTTTSTGALVKTGAGTLVISGDNLYSGGTTISEGAVLAESSSALGSGEIVVAGGYLTFSGEGVSVANALTVVLDSYVVAENVLDTASAGDVATDAAYAIALAGGAALVEGATISVTASDEFLSTLVDGETYDFAIISDNSVSIDYSGLVAAGYTVVNNLDGTISITTPEPSMFGLLAGLGALGFVAARRRRHNRKA
ncbi:MAG: autotransporter-associated beta strand repeat-containing protein [Opitutae bacterium]|nr:autotransporter-associated beta strand repeat-containing protein [Opitutae bacterium]